MTLVNMSLFPSHLSSPSLLPSAPRPSLFSAPSAMTSSILSATLSARSTVLESSATKSKLGFSIDSIVGQNSSRRRSLSPRSSSPITAERSPRDRSPIYRRSPSPDYRRSPSPGGLTYSRSDSPPSPSMIMRPIPTSVSGGGAGPSLLNPQSYLDQLASLKAFYEAKQNASPPPMMPANLPMHGLHPMLAGLPRPGLPGLLGGGGHHPGMPPHMVPREYPLYPWFINRHRFPGGTVFLRFN